VARKLLTLISLGILTLFLSACFRNTAGSLNVTYPNESQGRYNASIALEYLGKGRSDIAIQKINEALTQAPQDPLVLQAAGYFWEKMGDLELANRFYFKALTIAPASATIRNNYGAFLCRNGYSRTAIQNFMIAAHSPNSAESALAYSNARYCAKGLGDKAESAYYTGLLAQPISSTNDTNNGHRHDYWR
jgi:type IV pilus assembly protein PilF